MLTNPDPATVREIAQEVANIALHDAVHVDQWISAVVNSRFGNECSSFRAPLHTAVARRMAVVKPSWPDEPPQDGAAPDLWWPFTGGADTCYLSHDDDGGYRECCMRAGLAYALKVRDGDEVHTPAVGDGEDERDGYAVRLLDMLEADPDRFQESEEEDLRAALSALFRRTAEAANLASALVEAQAERNGDVRAVAALLAAVRVQGVPAATKRRAERLESRFHGRIAALEARDAKAGG